MYSSLTYPNWQPKKLNTPYAPKNSGADLATERRKKAAGPDCQSVLKAMGNQIAHRGPDDEQIVRSGPVGMIFRRLSIVDIEGGRQPMTNEDDTLISMVNGEIFNHESIRNRLKYHHVFRSRSDSEVVLPLYQELGQDFLHELNGMYAIALWDAKARQLLLARDRLGIKPLFYAVANQKLLFGSEIKALLAHPECPRDLDWEAALSFNQSRYFPSRHRSTTSFFKDIEYLPGGHTLTVRPGQKQILRSRYWDLQPLSNEEYLSDTRSDKEIINGYRDCFVEAVHDCLMADTEIGVFLSGGIDSVAISSIAAREQSFHTFSVLSQSTLGSADARSACLAAQRLALPNHQVLFRWQDRILTPESYKKLLWLLETPLCEAEHVYKYQLHRYAKATRPDLKVILLGQGSDEFNGGYSQYWLDFAGVPRQQQNWSAYMGQIAGMEQQKLLHASNPAILAQIGQKSIVKKSFLGELAGQQPYEHPWFANADASRFVLQMYNLWHEDRTAAGNGIENRVPFLDHRLVEYTMTVPPSRYQDLFWNKRILRHALSADLPAELAQRPKGPFYMGPDARFTRMMMLNILTADNNALIDEAFSHADHPVLETDNIRDVIKTIPPDSEYQQVKPLLVMINAALLENMANDARAQLRYRDETAILSSLSISDWDSEAAAIEAQLATAQTGYYLSDVLAFTPDTRLLAYQDAGGLPNTGFMLLSKGMVRQHFRANDIDAWLEVLKAVDGKQSIQMILQAKGIAESTISKQLREALELKLLCRLDS